MLLQWEHVLGAIASAKSQGNNVTRENVLMTSLLYYATAFCIGRLMRFFVSQATRGYWNGSLLQALLYDFVTSFQLMALSLENGQLRKQYGDNAYIFALFCTGAWAYFTIDKGRANPCTCVVEYMKGSYSARYALLSGLVQLCGGLLSYPYARAFWNLGLTRSHWQRALAIGCRSDLAVSSPIGFIIEFVATLLSSLVAFNTFSPYKNSEMLCKCIFSAYMTILGVDLTGMYLNPVNATNQTFGCRGPWHIEFFFVFWIAPLSATVLAVRAQNELRPFLKRLTATEKLVDNDEFDVDVTDTRKNPLLRHNGVGNGLVQRGAGGLRDGVTIGTERVTMVKEKGRFKKRYYVPSKMK